MAASNAAGRRLRLQAALVLMFNLATSSPGVLVAGAGCPSIVKGVLKESNKYRAKHGAPALKWDAALAKRAQGHADKCRWEHSSDRERNGSGENLYASAGRIYPYQGMDVCSYATYGWYMEVTSYDYDKPWKSRDEVQTGHFTQLVWAKTTKMGCGVAKCNTLANVGFPRPADYVVCQYHTTGNMLMISPDGSYSYSLYSQNVKRSSCQAATKDDWCQSCSGAKCTACYARENFNQQMAVAPIKLDVATRKCASACPPGLPTSANCLACTVNNSCLRCQPGWKLDKQQRCLLPARRS